MSPAAAGTTFLPYAEVRQVTERLADPLSAEDQTVQSMPDVSPTKWHRAHTTWFFETFLLEPYLAGYRTYHPAFGYLFNSYYEALGPRYPRPSRGLVSRPGVGEVAAYRQVVDEAMAALLEQPLGPEVLGLIELGINHEQQHQELMLMDIKHVLSCNPLDPAYRPLTGLPEDRDRSGSGSIEWQEHGGGLVEIGHRGAEDGFCFDNELPRHAVLLNSFVVASRPVTCGEWLEFIDDGGYRRPELWLADGWATVNAEGWEAPLYWSRRLEGSESAQWSVFTLHGRRPLALDEPVCHVSYYEADAYARWVGARLPTEAEWEAVATADAELAHGPSAGLSDLSLEPSALHPRPVGTWSPWIGDVWQWTSSSYHPYPGFRPAAGAVGEYNGKFMVNQQVLRGGCCVTPAGHRRITYRNFFPPSARWPFTGVRLAADG